MFDPLFTHVNELFLFFTHVNELFPFFFFLKASNRSPPRGANWRSLEWSLASGLGTNQCVDGGV